MERRSVEHLEQMAIAAWSIAFHRFLVTFSVVYLRLRIFARRRSRPFARPITTGNP